MAKVLKQFISGFLPLLFVFLASISRPQDPDLGWHLKYGEYFFQHLRILRENTFVTDMPNYHWVNMSWGVDILTYAFYHLGGFFGLSIASALVVTVTFYFFAKAFQLDFFEKALIFPIISYFEYLVVTVSFRGQLVSIMLLSILTYLIMGYEHGKKRALYLIPPLFLLWANLHGQFIIGLGVFGLWAACYLLSLFLENKKKLSSLFPQSKRLMFIGLASGVATLINPFGIGIYQETARYIHNPLLKDVTEYVAPAQLSTVWWNYILAGILVGIGVILLFFRDRIRSLLSTAGILGALYIASFIVKRYAWMMYYFTMPFLKPIAAFVKPDSKQASFWSATVLFFLLTAGTIYLKSPWQQFTAMSWATYCREFQGCSPEGARFLSSLPNSGRIMNLYGWGGWIIWNYPQIRPSIDGRMHLWKDERGFSAFENYYSYEQDLKNVDNSTYDTVFMDHEKSVTNRLNRLVREGKWKRIYEDNSSVIFIRVNKINPN